MVFANIHEFFKSKIFFFAWKVFQQQFHKLLQRIIKLQSFLSQKSRCRIFLYTINKVPDDIRFSISILFLNFFGFNPTTLGLQLLFLVWYFDLLKTGIRIDDFALIEILLNFINRGHVYEKWKTNHLPKALGTVIKISWHKVKRWGNIWLKRVAFAFSRIPKVHSLLYGFYYRIKSNFLIKMKNQSPLSQKYFKFGQLNIFLISISDQKFNQIYWKNKETQPQFKLIDQFNTFL